MPLYPILHPIRWIRQKFVSDNIAVTIANLFRLLGIRATYTNIKETLHSHPDFPSVLSIAESLPEWGVHTEAVQGDITDLSKEDYPNLAHLETDEFLVVLEEIRDGKARIRYSDKGLRTLSLEAFSEIWSGIILRISPGPDAGERAYRRNRRNEILAALRRISTFAGLPLLGILVFCYGLTGQEHFHPVAALAAIKTAGLLLCMVMVWESVADTGVLLHFCPAGKRANCQRVMSSPAGRILGIPMADLGLLYFLGGLFTLLIALFLNRVESNLYLLAWLTVLTLPYTLFSIGYQALVVRSWCWMCVVVQLLFWLEFYLLYDFIAPLALLLPISLIPGFALPALLWVALRPVFAGSARAGLLKEKLKRRQGDPDYIEMRLARSSRHDMGNFPYEAAIGPENAGITLTVVMNPLCGICWQTYDQLRNLIRICRGNVKAVIRFLVAPADDGKTETEVLLDHEVSLHILALARAGDRRRVEAALAGWFSMNRGFTRHKFRDWLAEYGTIEQDSRHAAEDLLKDQTGWAESCEIQGTPTIFIDGLKMPPEIQAEDLKYYFMRRFEE